MIPKVIWALNPIFQIPGGQGYVLQYARYDSLITGQKGIHTKLFI